MIIYVNNNYNQINLIKKEIMEILYCNLFLFINTVFTIVKKLNGRKYLENQRASN